MVCNVLRVDAFTQEIGKGNPAGVVLNGDDFNAELMQEIAKKVGFNETVFVCTSEKADIQLRYFTPGYETPLCGHATIGAVFALYDGKGDQELLVETGAGILPVNYDDQLKRITMRQATPKFVEFNGDKSALCKSLGIGLEDLHPKLPIQYGNTGSWTLLVPVTNESILAKMYPSTETFPDILKEIPRASIHPFAVLSESKGEFTARHFSSPYSGTIEDSVTGTASGVMGAYMLNQLYPEVNEAELTVFQGQHVQSQGCVNVHVIKNIRGECEVKISGEACFNKYIEII